MRRSRLLVAVVVALAVVVLGSGCATGRGASGGCSPAQMMVSPSVTEAGDRVTVSAPASSCRIDFTDDGWYELELAYARWDVTTRARIQVAADGSFTTTMRVPESAPPGKPIVSVASGYRSGCSDGGACAGTSAQFTVSRPSFVSPDLRALQRDLDAASSQRGRLVTTASSPDCLNLDRPWTTNIDLVLPHGWRIASDEVQDAQGQRVARIGDDVRVTIASTPPPQTRGCRKERERAAVTVTVTAMTVVVKEGPPPLGGRLLVGTDTALARTPKDAQTRVGTLRTERHRDYLCVTLDEGAGKNTPLAFPPGITALPNGTLIAADSTPIAEANTRVTARTAKDTTRAPAGCPTSRAGLGIYQLTASP